eukprot:TRINITY_DN1515_c0_g1_i3.p1 TRINITY_DN1515_c0_g1~~TRINITY_DN1515_c0_g1_i3.p1  ORF type:complete len:452 (-),score=80.03 TRINITY_DN1515_c0_g1_i3:1273-2628(-)
MRLIVVLILFSLLCFSEGAYRKLSYYTNWAQYRPCNKFLPENIQPIAKSLTHVHYAFAKFSTNGDVSPIEWNDCVSGAWPGCQGNPGSTMYDKIIALKGYNPSLKLMIDFGGWSWGGVVVCPTFSALANNANSRNNFISQVIKYARTFGFDGIEIDWEYPGATDLGCNPYDTQNFLALIQGLSSQIASEASSSGKPKLILSIAAPAGKANIDTSNLPAVYKYLDYINLMTYDYEGPWENVTGENAPLYDPASNMNVNFTVSYYQQLGIPLSLINLGFASYGHDFSISSSLRPPYGVGTPVQGAGAAGKCTGQTGTLAYYEILTFLAESGVTKVFNTTYQTPYAYTSNSSPNTWVGYDDVQSFNVKLNYLKSKGLGGAFTWSLDLGSSGINAEYGDHHLLFIPPLISSTLQLTNTLNSQFVLTLVQCVEYGSEQGVTVGEIVQIKRPSECTT